MCYFEVRNSQAHNMPHSNVLCLYIFWILLSGIRQSSEQLKSLSSCLYIKRLISFLGVVFGTNTQHVWGGRSQVFGTFPLSDYHEFVRQSWYSLGTPPYEKEVSTNVKLLS
jgi:hypothetical protein